MKCFDFLSSSPTLYLLKEDRGKNKIGGFFSMIFALLMISLIIYYFYVYLSGSDYNLTYYRENRTTYMNEKETNSTIRKQFYFSISKNINNAKIIPILMDDYNNTKYAEKCEFNPAPKYFNNGEDIFCFELIRKPFNTSEEGENRYLHLTCEENCVDNNGKPAIIDFILASDELKMVHSNGEPFENSGDLEGYAMTLEVGGDSANKIFKYIYTPRIYNTTKIFSNEIGSYANTYLNSLQYENSYKAFSSFAEFSFDLTFDCDVYLREYITLLDTLSKIGGLFSPFNLLFQVLVMFYSELEINSEITKNVFSKIKNYEYKQINKIKINNNSIDNIDFEIAKEAKETSELRKKFNINKIEQYFCSFFNFCCDTWNFCKTHRTTKILNLCSDFIRTYLSVENIIFNMILFENYYKENPIKYNYNSYLNNIDKEIENKNIKKNILLVPLNSKE